MKNNARKYFDENGYYIARGVFSSKELGRLEEEFDRIVAQLKQSAAPYGGPNAADDNGIISTTNVQKYSSRWLTEGMLHKGFLDIAEQLIGPDIVLKHSSLYEKRKSNVVGPFRMHQDWIYGPTQNDTMISGMIHISRATAQMGALRVYPGTHRTRIESSWANDEGAVFHERFPLERSTALEAEAGDVVFFHYCTVHGSMSNQSDEPRKAVHVRMLSGKDCGETEGLPIENLVLRGWNHHANVSTTATAKQ